MNRFQESQLYQGKNSLVANFLSHCDLYRPRFFLLENIEDLIKYKGGLVLRLCVRALTKMICLPLTGRGREGCPTAVVLSPPTRDS